jgi:hypothetical protein
MKSAVLNEIDNMKYLFNYDRSKTINEQQETPVPTPPYLSGSTQPVPTPPASGSTQPPVPTPPASGSTQPPVSTPQAMSSSRIELGATNDPYQYKFEDDGNVQKYYYAKKGQNNWKQSTNPKSVEAIKKNVFKIR